jgi:putative SOS response-associated peptidase YedK
MWRDPMRHTRCLLPAEGWYEWQEVAGGKQPHYITREDRGLFCFAGLMSTWQDQLSCAILTKEAEGPVADINDRMPVVLADVANAGWLDPALQDATDYARANAQSRDFMHYPVSKRVNNARNEGAELIEPLASPP